MKCRKCGAYIKEGYTFCRVCSTSIELINDIILPLDTQKTNFINNGKLKEIKSKLIIKKQDNYNNITVLPQEINNKDLIYKDQNNRTKATIDNIGGLILILIVILILVLLILKAFSIL